MSPVDKRKRDPENDVIGGTLYKGYENYVLQYVSKYCTRPAIKRQSNCSTIPEKPRCRAKFTILENVAVSIYLSAVEVTDSAS